MILWHYITWHKSTHHNDILPNMTLDTKTLMKMAFIMTISRYNNIHHEDNQHNNYLAQEKQLSLLNMTLNIPTHASKTPRILTHTYNQHDDTESNDTHQHHDIRHKDIYYNGIHQNDT
jgi:hypothetical protein